MKSNKKSVRQKNGAASGSATLLHEGIKFAKSGNTVEAMELLLKASQSASKVTEGGGEKINEAALMWLASLTDDMNDAARYLRLAIELNPENKQARIGLSNALLRLGVDYSKSGDKNGARAALLESSELNPLNEPVWLWLATMADESDDVITWLNNALEINPASERAIKWLEIYQERNRRYDPALQIKIAEEEAEAAIKQNEEAEKLRASVDARAIEAELALSETEARLEEETLKYEEIQEQLTRYEVDELSRIEEIKQAENEKEKIEIELKENISATQDLGQKILEEETRIKQAQTELDIIAQSVTETEILIIEAQEQLQAVESSWNIDANDIYEESEFLNLNGNLSNNTMTDDQITLLNELKSLAEIEYEMTRAALVEAQNAEKRIIEAEEASRISEEKWREKCEARESAEKAVRLAHDEFTRSLAAKRDAENARAEADAAYRKETAIREETETRLTEARSIADSVSSAKQEAQKRFNEAKAKLDNLLKQLTGATLSIAPDDRDHKNDFSNITNNTPAFEARTVDIPRTPVNFSMKNINFSSNNPATLNLSIHDVDLKFKPVKFALVIIGIVATICILYFIEHV